MARRNRGRKAPRRSASTAIVSSSRRRSSGKGGGLLMKALVVGGSIAGGALAEQLIGSKMGVAGRAIVAGVGAAVSGYVLTIPRFTRGARKSAIYFGAAGGVMYGARGWLGSKVADVVFRIRNGAWPKAGQATDPNASYSPERVDTFAYPTGGAPAGTMSYTPPAQQQQLPAAPTQAAAPPTQTIIYQAQKDNSTPLERIIGSLAGAAADFGAKVLTGSKGSVSEEDALAYAIA